MPKLYALTSLNVDGEDVAEGAEFELSAERAKELDLVGAGLAAASKPKEEKEEE